MYIFMYVHIGEEKGDSKPERKSPASIGEIKQEFEKVANEVLILPLGSLGRHDLICLVIRSS